ncbi:hypothetical protein B0H17DRAFT_1120781 [Mycena rosella]|uniref:Uncharacterized protein n=1 Tax=Mycena rosella TaxID=1033263 RepID=A0AAD7AYU2_MYCRO|nr:hypothetical protein B0H17DRAFT_1120781 [Mycena rosella]
MQRPIVSYDDITLPYQPTPPRNPPASSPSNASQSKKRKWSNQKTGQQQANQSAAPVNAPPADEDEEGDEGEDMDSRYLTSEEMWDDSALIDAWNAATEEYEAFNGPDKGWKNEPVHKSPLCVSAFLSRQCGIIPPDEAAEEKAEDEDAGAADAAPPAGEGDSQSLDFATFVPTYDASLALPTPESGDAGAGQDEAFSRALGAMYWGGYWTAVYHRTADRRGDAAAGRRRTMVKRRREAEEEAFVSTQR